MKLIVITSDKEVKDEVVVINELFRQGLLILHIRKPYTSINMVDELLSKINTEYHNRIVLHDYFELAESFAIKGIHLNSRNPDIPEGFQLSVSKSCHSLDCLADINRFNYVFLSPIFNSISKNGYNSNFLHEQLKEAQRNNMINDKVIALGGIDSSNIGTISEYGFGGVAVLGALWKSYLQNNNIDDLIRDFVSIRDKCNQL